MKKTAPLPKLPEINRLLPIVGRGASGIERGGHMAKAKLARGPVDAAAAGAELASFVIRAFLCTSNLLHYLSIPRRDNSDKSFFTGGGGYIII